MGWIFLNKCITQTIPFTVMQIDLGAEKNIHEIRMIWRKTDMEISLNI